METINNTYFLIKAKKGNEFYNDNCGLTSKIQDAKWFDHSELEAFLRFFDIDRSDVVIVHLLVQASEMDCVI